MCISCDLSEMRGREYVVLLTIHDSYDTAGSTAGIHIVIACLSCGPTNIAALASRLSRDVAGMKCELHIAK